MTPAVVADHGRVVDRLKEFYTPAEIELWLLTNHPMLGGECAIDLIRDRRAEEVLLVIDGVDSGAYV